MYYRRARSCGEYGNPGSQDESFRSVPQRAVAALIWVGVCALAQAATLESVVQAIAFPVDSRSVVTEWKAVERVPGIKWKHPGLRSAAPVAPGAFLRTARLSIAGHGPSDLIFTGTRDGVDSVSVMVDGAMDKPFTSTLARQFPGGATFKRVQGGCREEGVLGGSSVFLVTLPARKAVYLYIMTGPSNKGEGSTVFDFAHQYPRSWQC